MSNLSKAIGRYYAREGNKVMFKNGQSLSQLAMAMWERLGCKQIDASVLSRVIKGERLFTTAQLQAFCQLMALSKIEQDYLQACLNQDYNSRLALKIDTAQIPAPLAAEIIKELTADASATFYSGQYETLDRKHELIQQLANTMLSVGSGSTSVDEQIGFSIYLHGRTIANGEMPNQVISKLSPIFRQLISMSQSSHSQLLYGYAYVLWANAYYLAGGYSKSADKSKYYASSIKFAKKALDNLPETNHESLFALRIMAASASYTHNQEVVMHALHKTKAIIPLQPEDNYINSLHLSSTLNKGLASFGLTKGFSITDYAKNHFKRDLANTGVYEVSAIKDEIESLLLLKSQDKKHLQTRLKEGLKLATDYNFQRQQSYFNKLLSSL